MLQRAYARSIVPLSQWQALLSPHTRGAEVAIPSAENLRGRFTCFSRPDRTASSCPVSMSRRCAAQLPASPRPMGCIFASTIRRSSDSPEPVPTPRPLHDWRRRTDRSARTVLSHQVVALRISVEHLKTEVRAAHHCPTALRHAPCGCNWLLCSGVCGCCRLRTGRHRATQYMPWCVCV